MANEIRMPQLGLTMEEGTVGKWLVSEGDEVKEGDILAEIETDKITTELESEYEGIILKIVASEGDDIKVQGILAYIGKAGETVPDIDNYKENTPSIGLEEAVLSSEKEELKRENKRVKISPLAKKIAKNNNIDYSQIVGSGPGGRIRKIDIIEKMEKPQEYKSKEENEVEIKSSFDIPKEEDIIKPLTGMRKVVGQRMLSSHLEIPPVTQSVRCNVNKLLELRKDINKDRENKISINDFIIKALAKAISENRYMNVSLGDGKIIEKSEVNIGVAVALDEGLLTPVIKNADKKSLSIISDEAKDLASRARQGKLEVTEYQGTTFSITNIGMFDIDFFTPIINQPDAAILGVCNIEEELALVNGEIVVNKMMRLPMTYDHRLIDGAIAAKFQAELKKLIENPMEILI